MNRSSTLNTSHGASKCTVRLQGQLEYDKAILQVDRNLPTAVRLVLVTVVLTCEIKKKAGEILLLNFKHTLFTGLLKKLMLHICTIKTAMQTIVIIKQNLIEKSLICFLYNARECMIKNH